MNTYIRIPEWEVIIQRPDFTKSTLTFKNVPEWSSGGLGFGNISNWSKSTKVSFVSDKSKANGTNNYTDLIGYEYENQLSNPTGAFSLTIVPRQDSNGLTWKDKIKASDIVYISEFGKVRYIGIVKGTGYQMSLSNGKPQRKISITGESIGGKLQSFSVPMNKYLWFGQGIATVEVENEKFSATLSSKMEEGQNFGDLFKSIKDQYIRIALGSKTNGIAGFLNNFFDLEVDNLKAHYPVLLRLFQQDENTLWQMFRQVLPAPVYEIFGRYIDGKYKMICRETPFDYDTWNALPITELNPLYLIDQNLSDSDAEVYTHFMSLMPNSALSENEIYANSSLGGVSVFDEDKLAIYGYRQLQANFPFFDLNQGKEFSSIDYLKANSRRLYAWYYNNVDFQSGEITMHTVEDQYINIGERIKYLCGADIQFYVEGVKRRMTYPETMTSTYSVTRGYEYGVGYIKIDGVRIKTPQFGDIVKLGRKLIDTEHTVCSVNNNKGIFDAGSLRR